MCVCVGGVRRGVVQWKEVVRSATGQRQIQEQILQSSAVMKKRKFGKSASVAISSLELNASSIGKTTAKASRRAQAGHPG